MDLTDVGKLVAEQMEALEESDYPEGTSIPGVLTAVVIRLPDGEATVRCRVSLPHPPPVPFQQGPMDYRYMVSSLLIKGILQHSLTEGWL